MTMSGKPGDPDVSTHSAFTIDEQKAIEALGQAFAVKTVQPMLSRGGPDGDSLMVSGILKEAASIGLLAEHGEGMSGTETGIWGTIALSAGPAMSLNLLKNIAQVCGGISANFHASGIGNLAAGMFKLNVTGRLAYVMPDFDGLHIMPSLNNPAVAYKTASIKGDYSGSGYLIHGDKGFLLQARETSSYIIALPLKTGDTYSWGVMSIPASDSSVKIEAGKKQMGIRSAEIIYLNIYNKNIIKQDVILLNNIDYILLLSAYYLAGIVAILSGIAKGAVASAIKYAGERYQGTKLIIEHPAVRFLIAESETRISAVEAMLEHVPKQSHDAKSMLKYASGLKWFGSVQCVQAITDSLQVFGGYGYMEDYGMEKRLRDGETLKSLSGSSVVHRHTVMDTMEV